MLSHFDKLDLNFRLRKPVSLVLINPYERFTTLRYKLFYMDDFVQDSYKMKAQIKYESSGQHVFDLAIIHSPAFQQYLQDNGQFFNVDVSPTAKNPMALDFA